MHSRSEWTQRVPAWTPARRFVPDIFIHHEGGAIRGIPADKPRVLREIESGVLGKGYIAIDYNIMVFNDGDIWEGRGLPNEDGATIHNNPTSVSICAVGNYQTEAATDALVNGIALACQIAAQAGWTVIHPNIRPHRDVFATACPGANLYARMSDIRLAAQGTIPGPGPAPKPQPKRQPQMFILRDQDTPGQIVDYVSDWMTGKRKIENQDELGAIRACFTAQGIPSDPIVVARKHLAKLPVLPNA